MCLKLVCFRSEYAKLIQFFINSIINANFVLQPDTALSLKMPLIFNVCGY
nr:MAG TPA: hypothetical protein [Caudoviricetes sp.]